MIGLAALAATISEARRAQRFIALTGIGTEELRFRAADPALLAAVLRFLEAHEPDLLSVAQHIGVQPEVLVLTRLELEKGTA